MNMLASKVETSFHVYFGEGCRSVEKPDKQGGLLTQFDKNMLEAWCRYQWQSCIISAIKFSIRCPQFEQQIWHSSSHVTAT